MRDIFNVHVGRAVSISAENKWSPDSRKVLHFTCYDQLQWEYEDKDFQPRTEFLPSLAIKCAAEARPHPNLLPLPVWISVFLCFSHSLCNQSTHIHIYTLLLNIFTSAILQLIQESMMKLSVDTLHKQYNFWHMYPAWNTSPAFCPNISNS